MDAKQCTTLVSDFLESWESRDIEHIMSFFADDAVYHNVPVAPLVGTAAIRAVFEAFLAAFTSARLEIISISGQPDLVLSERIDHFVMQSGAVVTLPVAGVFEIRDGKIARFSDYFDLATFETASGLKL